jgi:uncharacterized protein (TIGR03435 family)
MLRPMHIEETVVLAPKRGGFLPLAVACGCAWMISIPRALAQVGVPAPAPVVSNHNAPPARTLAFDVASIKPIAPGGRPTAGWVGEQNRPDGVEFAYQSLTELLCYAYGYKSLRFDGQVTGVPAWAETQRYDIQAKIASADMAEFQKLGKDEQEQWREAMMQSLLAERFHLTIHRGSKQIPIYELVVAKGGIKMQDAATDPNPTQLGKGDDGKPLSTLRMLKDTSVWQAESMEMLTVWLTQPAAQVGRPVLNKTGLTGAYNFTLDWSIYSAHAAASLSPEDDATSIFTALGKIGLKLQPSTGSMETIIIDHVDKPSED